MDDDECSEVASTSSTAVMLKLCDDVTLTCKKFRGLLEKYDRICSSLNSEKGVSLFDVKSDAMFTYTCNVLYLMLKKCCGLSVQDPQAREKIGQIRVILEKIKPLELKLKYQIEKYIKMASAEDNSGAADKSNFRAKIENLRNNENVNENEFDDDDNNGDDEDSDSEEDESLDKEVKSSKSSDDKAKQIYKPPKLAAVPYDDSREEDKRKRRLEQSKKRALSTSIIQELKEEYLDTPLEIASSSTSLRNKRTNYRQEKESYEETYFTRLPTTKKERHRDKQMSSLTLGTLGTEVTRFEDISALDERAADGPKKRKKNVQTKKKGIKKRRTRS